MLNPDYIVGLVDGEGSFTVYIRNPNNLKEARRSALMTQAQLAVRTQQLAIQDPSRFVSLRVGSIKHLERGAHRPLRRSAITLALALGSSIDELFPVGVEENVHNPTGITRIPLDRKRGGRPRKR